MLGASALQQAMATKAWTVYTAVRARVGLHRHACRECGLHADLAAQIGSHQFFDGFFRVTAAEEVVQFGDSGFGGHVAAADGAGLRADGGGVFDNN